MTVSPRVRGCALLMLLVCIKTNFTAIYSWQLKLTFELSPVKNHLFNDLELYLSQLSRFRELTYIPPLSTHMYEKLMCAAIEVGDDGKISIMNNFDEIMENLQICRKILKISPIIFYVFTENSAHVTVL